MTSLKYKCDHRTNKYESWELYDVSTLLKVDKSKYDVCPFRDKLMNQDTFSVDDTGVFKEITHSCNRSLPVIPAIMTFSKMYGKTKNNKYYFKATPDDVRVPEFIIPYKIKNLGFAKKQPDKYVIIKYEHWENKHPVGSIIHTIGDVEVLPHFYEYMLYCKSLHASIQQFTKDTLTFLQNTNEDEHVANVICNPKYRIKDRTEEHVICIDPNMSKDFDDGFSINECEYNGVICTRLSIYIANVPVWIDSMNLWSSFSERISTIYLPDRKRPMLPTILSDNLCSLQSGKKRIAFTIDIYVDATYKIVHYDFINTVINVANNYTYDDMTGLYKDKTYIQTFNLISELNHHTRYKYMDEIIDSHDVVAYLMVMMNYLSAQNLKNHKTGIFRTIKLKTEYNIPDHTPKKISRFIQGWNSTGGKYLKFEDYGAHEILRLDAYVHITSPIRRLVDILNIMLVMKHNNLFNYETTNSNFVSDAEIFFNKWTSKERFTYINTSMRAIRKLQNRCDLLNKFDKSPEMLDKYYEGYCFDKLDRNDGLFQYVVYIPELNIVSKYTGQINIEDFKTHNFQLYLFKDEGTFRQKIKMNLVE